RHYDDGMAPRAEIDEGSLTVGSVARRTGLSVRTLHHYHSIGLLKPSRRTGAGYRLYSTRDLMRLEQVVLLRSLGLPLEDIAVSLARGGQTLLDTIQLHLDRLKARIERERAICRKLEETARRLQRRETPTVDDIVRTIQGVIMSENYF